MNRRLRPAQISYPEKERENEKAHRVSDDVIPEQRRCNDARGVLPAGNLNCHKEGRKCKDDERKRERNGRVEQRLRAIDTKSKPLPSKVGFECARKRPNHLLE